MNEENIAKVIKDIRLKNNMSQKDFADKFGVTYQAVSKWENGKNIPDISILKEICKEYNLSLDELVDVQKTKKSKKLLGILIIVILVCVCLLLFIIFHQHDFEFKTITSNCTDFNVTGSIAYNKEKSSIYISSINYCGNEKLEKYDSIKCSFYEDNGKVKTIIDNCKQSENLNLKDYLQNVTFQIDNYIQTCKKYNENSLYLEIEAIKEGKVTQYKIPLKLKDNCK